MDPPNGGNDSGGGSDQGGLNDFGNFVGWLESEIFQENNIPYEAVSSNPPPPQPYNPYGGVPIEGFSGYRYDSNSSYDTDFCTGVNIGVYNNEPYMNDDTVNSTGVGHGNPEYRSVGGILNHCDGDDDDDRFSLPDDDLEAEIWYQADMHKLCTIALLQAVQERQKLLKKKVPFHTSPLQGRGYMDDLWNSHPWRFYKVLKMPKMTFLKIVEQLKTIYGWTFGRSDAIDCDEALAMFIHLLRGFSNDELQERFQHSGETISQQIHKMLRCLRKFNYDKIQPTRRQDDPHPYLDRRAFYAPFKVQIVLSGMAFHNFIRRDRDPEDYLFPQVESQAEFAFKDLPDKDPTLADREDMPQYGVLNDENDPYMNCVRNNIRDQLRRQRRRRQRSAHPFSHRSVLLSLYPGSGKIV
ncbi:hypothetical protein Vadar_001536 [Vaccinium darrowii]|uniref:Uncharacterized protein n=1 Tax=Vaccinium darrowii TaxID=229202 RepID=A0ACB7ZH61_9ERIC|nr:hypothetical protein Vadar_001536 [Vaccinium darrowii]